MRERDWAHEMEVNATYRALLMCDPAEWGRMTEILGRPKSPVIDQRRVYFVQSEASSLIKIGVSGDVARRVRQISGTLFGEVLRILATEPGGRDRERTLHDRFHFARVKGEWFRPDPRLLAYVAPLQLRL